MILLSNVLTFLALPTLLKAIRDGTKQKPLYLKKKQFFIMTSQLW